MHAGRRQVDGPAPSLKGGQATGAVPSQARKPRRPLTGFVVCRNCAVIHFVPYPPPPSQLGSASPLQHFSISAHLCPLALTLTPHTLTLKLYIQLTAVLSASARFFFFSHSPELHSYLPPISCPTTDIILLSRFQPPPLTGTAPFLAAPLPPLQPR